LDHPERREFKSRPDQTALFDSGLYVAACLTIATAYMVARIPGRLRPLPTFEGWWDRVRSALVWLVCQDPASTIEAARGDDDREAEAAALFAAWPRGAGALNSYTSAELIEEASKGDGNGALARPDLLEALKPIARDRRGNLNAATLGYWLRDHKDRVIKLSDSDALKLKRRGPDTRPSWSIIEASKDKKQ
jgi:hypothetical protein